MELASLQGPGGANQAVLQGGISHLLLELVSLFGQCQRPPPGEIWTKLPSHIAMAGGAPFMAAVTHSTTARPTASSVSHLLLGFAAALFCLLLFLKPLPRPLTLLLFLQRLVPGRNTSPSRPCWGSPKWTAEERQAVPPERTRHLQRPPQC